MSTKPLRSQVLTVPNLVSLTRLLGVGWFWWVLTVDDNITLAAWLTFFIGWTDWIDGYLARRLDQVTELGRILDPVADRLMIVSAIVGGLIVGVVPGIIGIPLLIREAAMGSVTLYLASRGGGTLSVRYWGKLATFSLYGAIPAFYLAEGGFLAGLMFSLAWVFGVLGLILYWAVMFQYLGETRERLRALESPSGPEVMGVEED